MCDYIKAIKKLKLQKQKYQTRNNSSVESRRPNASPRKPGKPRSQLTLRQESLKSSFSSLTHWRMLRECSLTLTILDTYTYLSTNLLVINCSLLRLRSFPNETCKSLRRFSLESTFIFYSSDLIHHTCGRTCTPV